MINKIMAYLTITMFGLSNTALADNVDKAKDEMLKMVDKVDVNKLSSKASTLLHSGAISASTLLAVVIAFFLLRFVISSIITVVSLALAVGGVYLYVTGGYHDLAQQFLHIDLP